MQPMLNIASQAAIHAGKIINQHVDRLDTVKVNLKGFNDFVTDVDKKVETVITQALQAAYPEHNIIGEEQGDLEISSDYTWLIDPIDGTTNFMHGFPQFAVSIALQYKKETCLGVIYDPNSHELFTCIKGKGAKRDNKKIRVSAPKTISRSLIGTGFPARNATDIDTYLKVFKDILSQTSGVRRAGSAALDLAYVASGRLNGFWESGLKPWDIAAGMLMISEAGGIVTDFQGQEACPNKGEVVAGSAVTHKILLSAIKRHHQSAEGDKSAQIGSE